MKLRRDTSLVSVFRMRSSIVSPRVQTRGRYGELRAEYNAFTLPGPVTFPGTASSTPTVHSRPDASMTRYDDPGVVAEVFHVFPGAVHVDHDLQRPAADGAVDRHLEPPAPGRVSLRVSQRSRRPPGIAGERLGLEVPRPGPLAELVPDDGVVGAWRDGVRRRRRRMQAADRRTRASSRTNRSSQ